MISIKRSLIFTVAMLVVTACQPATPPPPTPTQERFTVVPVYREMLDYIDAARAVKDPDLVELTRVHIIEPHLEKCGGEEYIPPPGSIFDQPIEDLDALEESIHTLETSNIEEVVLSALERSSQFLDGPNTTVCIIAADPSNWFIRERMNGVNGWTFGSGKIILQVYPTADWKLWVPYVVAHEYHHSTWTSLYYRANQPEELMDRLVFEGKADSFAHIVYPDIQVPWTNALKGEEEREQWKNIQAERDSTNSFVKASYMVGDNDETPTWTGYTIGFHIVQSYLRSHPTASIQTWTKLSPGELLEASGYNGSY